MTKKEEWEPRYQAGDHPWDSGHPSSELQRVVSEYRLRPAAALELGCGTGTNAVWLAQQGIAVTAVDISPTAIKRARASAAGAAIRFLVADVTEVPDLGGPFDFLFDRGCYHCVRQQSVQGYLSTLEKNLGPQATGLILAGNDREPRTGPPQVSEQQIRGELSPLFDIVRLREFRFDIVGDQPAHLAWSCLVRRRAPRLESL
jgi:SAM-dependent methyltransferase